MSDVQTIVTPGDDALLTVEDVARRLAVSRGWVYAAAEAGTLPHFKLGRYLRFDRTAIDAFLARQRRGRLA